MVVVVPAATLIVGMGMTVIMSVLWVRQLLRAAVFGQRCHLWP